MDSPEETNDAGVRHLWGAVIRQAKHDLARADESTALDALEFLRDTGAWLVDELALSDSETLREEIVRIVLERNRRTGKELPVWNLPPATY